MNTTQQLNNNIKFFLPCDIEKGKNEKGDVVMRFKGVASTGSKDSQGEELDPSSFNLDEFRTINWNHGKSPDLIIGTPTKSVVKGNQLDIEGELYSEMPQAIATYNLMKALKKRGKTLGLSVEGKVISRDPNNPSRITKAKITGCAITPNPINSDTFAELIEKGYSNTNEWEYETEILDEFNKAMSVEENQHIVKEDVEGKKNKKKTEEVTDIIEDEGENKKSLLKKLSKADVYEHIFSYFYDKIDINKAKSIYNLIEKITAMSTEKTKEITEETIVKAFEILEKADTTAKSVTKGDEEDEDEKEMMTKAKTLAKKYKGEGMEKAEVVSKMIEKGFNETLVNKAYDSLSEEPVVKSDNSDILKSLDSVADNINTKFAAMADIFKAQSEQITTLSSDLSVAKEDLKKSYDSVEALTEKINAFSKTPAERRAVTKFSDRQFGEEGFQKSEDGKMTFNLADGSSRKALIGHLTELSDINKGGKFDEELVRIAQGIEISKGIEPRSLSRLKALNIEVIQNQE